MNQKLKPKLKQIKPLFWITPAVVVLIFASLLTGWELRDSDYDTCIYALEDTVKQLNGCIIANMTNGFQADICQDMLAECDSCVQAMTGTNQTRDVCKAALSSNETVSPCSATEAVDMRANCYKGCQFVTQPIFNISNSMNNTNLTIAIDWYDKCTAMCEERYTGSGEP